MTCLLLAFCVWMLFSAVAVNLNKGRFSFHHRPAFFINRPAFTFRRDITGPPTPLWYPFWRALLDRIKYRYPDRALYLVRGGNPEYYYSVLGIYYYCAAVRFCRANFASSMGNISFFFPKAKQGSALGVNGGLGNLGVSVMQMVAPAVIFLPLFTFLGVHGVTQPDGSTITLSNAALVWVPLLLLATVARHGSA